MSNIAFCTAKAPIAHETRIIGAMVANGTRSTEANSGTVASTMTQAGEVAEIHRGDEPPHEVLLLDEQQRAGLQAPHHQPAEQHRGGAGAGNAERQHRQQRRGAGGMGGSLRCQHPSILPVPKLAPSREKRLARL